MAESSAAAFCLVAPSFALWQRRRWESLAIPMSPLVPPRPLSRPRMTCLLGGARHPRHHGKDVSHRQDEAPAVVDGDGAVEGLVRRVVDARVTTRTHDLIARAAADADLQVEGQLSVLFGLVAAIGNGNTSLPAMLSIRCHRRYVAVHGGSRTFTSVSCVLDASAN